MKKFYQTEWQNIPFSGFAKLSHTTLAGPEFYNAFYRAVFEKYQGYEDLDPGWRLNKIDLTDWLAGHFHEGDRVLSVGCGLGYMEARLWQRHGDRIDFHVYDYAADAHCWLKQVMPEDHIHFAGEQQDMALTYDYIYLCAVDYAMADFELVQLITQLKERLHEKGQIILISASFLPESNGFGIASFLKETTKTILRRLMGRQKGQFWGWMRTRAEYRNLMQASNLASIKDGFFETEHQQTYWIKGTKE